MLQQIGTGLPGEAIALHAKGSESVRMRVTITLSTIHV
jgi:hypothetical protein